MRIRGEVLVRAQLVSLILLALLLCSPASAQSFLGIRMPESEIFAGYSVLRFDSVPLGFSQRLNLNGANLELSFPNLYQGLGVVADFSGHHSSEMESFNFLAGPQYRYDVKGMHVFGHALFGESRTRLLQVGTSQIEPSTLGRTLALGGGLDIPWGERFSLRPVQADYMINSAFGSTRNNIRYSTGLVIRFGKPKKTPSF
jgi:hypothetical protein